MNREEAKFEVSKKIGEIEDRFLLEANQHKIKKKKKFLLPMVACVALLCGGFYTTREIQVYNLGAGYTYITWKSLDGSRGTQVYYPIDESRHVLERRDLNIYYILEDNNKNISNFCSEYQYIADVQLDNEGTGFILAMGGDTSQAGFSFYFYQNGEYIFGRYELYEYHPTEDRVVTLTSGAPFSGQEYDFAEKNDFYSLDGKKLTPWHSHADSQFTKDIPEEYWGNYPETFSFSSGDGEKVDETIYQFETMDSSSIGMSKEGEN